MALDIELYRRTISTCIGRHRQKLCRISAIDIHPEGATRTLVLIHGYGGSAAQWLYQMQFFGQTMRVIAPDMRGHGRSDDPENLPYTMQGLVDDLEAVVISTPESHETNGASEENASPASPFIEAFVVLKRGEKATSDELLALCCERFDAYKVPRQIVRSEPSKNFVGKVLRRLLVETRKLSGNGKCHKCRQLLITAICFRTPVQFDSAGRCLIESSSEVTMIKIWLNCQDLISNI